MNIGMRILAAAVLSAAISFPASAIGGPGVPPPPGAPKTPGYQAPVPPALRAPAPNARAYGPTGQFAGSVSRDGRTYDSTGHYVGRADSSGRIYGPTGKYVGRSDSYARQQNAPKPVSGSLNR